MSIKNFGTHGDSTLSKPHSHRTILPFHNVTSATPDPENSQALLLRVLTETPGDGKGEGQEEEARQGEPKAT